MDVGIGAAEVAQRLLHPERFRLEEEPLMGGAPSGGGDRQADLEGHVESRCATGSLNAAEIMEGVPAGGDQRQDPIQPARRPGKFERCAWAKPEAAETRDECKEERLVAQIVGNVEEGVVGGVSLSDWSGSARQAPPRYGSAPGTALASSCLGAPVRRAIAAVTLQILGNHRPELAITLRGDAEDTGCGSRRRVRGRDYCARSQGHGVTLRSEGFLCQRPRKDTAAQLARRKRS